jgi:hypothetical protein
MGRVGREEGRIGESVYGYVFVVWRLGLALASRRL